MHVWWGTRKVWHGMACMYACIWVCLCVCISVCVCLYVCMHGWVDRWKEGCMAGWLDGWMDGMNACMHACLYCNFCMYVMCLMYLMYLIYLMCAMHIVYVMYSVYSTDPMYVWYGVYVMQCNATQCNVMQWTVFFNVCDVCNIHIYNLYVHRCICMCGTENRMAEWQTPSSGGDPQCLKLSECHCSAGGRILRWPVLTISPTTPLSFIRYCF